jgi:hypothetical protein
MEGFDMIESPLIAELLAEAEAKAKLETLLRVMRKRYTEVPEAMLAPIRACADGGQLDRWLDAALDADTLEKFRQRTGL